MSDTTCPATRTRPEVGHVTREISLSSVVLPAPLRPMIPRPAPCGTSNETSGSPWMVAPTRPRVALCTSSAPPRQERTCEAIRSTSVRERPVRYRLLTRSSWMAIDMEDPRRPLELDDVREVPIGALEQHDRR